MRGVVLALLLGAAQAQRSPETLATPVFAELGVREVPCPDDTFDGGNKPVCGQTQMLPEVFTEAFDETAQGRLEPLGAWNEDHGVWLRRYRAHGVLYAAVYTPLVETFNVQLVRLKQPGR